MVSAISGNSLAQALPARVDIRKAQETAGAAPVVDAGTDIVPSAQAVATARVGGQLDAQFDAGRVQRAQEEAAAVDGGDGEAGTAAADMDGTAAAGASGTAAPAAGGARTGGGAAGSDSGVSDYIAEADTNNDRKVSEEERAAYAKKQASEAQSKAAAPLQQSREQEVRQAYVPREAAGAQFEVSV